MRSFLSSSHFLLLPFLSLFAACSSHVYTPPPFNPDSDIANASEARNLDTDALAAKHRIRRDNFISKTFLETPPLPFDPCVPNSETHFRLEADITQPGNSTFRLVIASQRRSEDGSVGWTQAADSSARAFPLTREKELSFIDDSLGETFSAPIPRDYLENISDDGVALTITGGSTPVQIYLPKPFVATLLRLVSLHASGEKLNLRLYYE